tara:strand:+ start:269 stop:796 length:528 start_codon:yes stop_codon:yes gene_type:complete
MKKLNLKYAASILLTLFVSSNSLSNSTHSVGVGVNNTSVDIINITSPGIAYEYRSSDSLALEVGLYFGGSDGIASGSAAAAVEINALASTKLKYGGASGNMKYYVFGGYTSIDGDSIACGSGSCFVFSDTFGGLTAGVGVDFDLGDKWILGGQYSTGFGDIDETDFMGLSLRYKF